MSNELLSDSTSNAMRRGRTFPALPALPALPKTMRAAVCVQAGDPETLEIHELPVPAVREGWSLVQVKGAGLNRSVLRTRQGHSPNVTFPRVLGIECVGTVAASTDPR